MKYRKKPVVIEATQWLGHDRSKGKEDTLVRYFNRPDIPGVNTCKQCEYLMHDHGWIDTLEGGHIVCPNDWIITGVEGEKYPCKPSIFAATYDPV
jgi:hypothetical protein